MVEDCRRAFGVHAAPCHTRTVEDCWKRTPSDWIKVNVDVAVSQVNNSEGIGAVIRDCDGGWLLGSVRFVGRCNVLFAELWTIHNSLAQAWIHGYHHVKLELDILEAVRIVTSSTAILQMADKMAVKGRVMNFTTTFFVTVPRDIEALVDGEKERSVNVAVFPYNPGGNT
ncbi:hypothetical protein V6N11_055734 [Hibiscus sabdariffa]|uniref:RNase H type-1 domain-containing protein n=1 Tax=Hibiscus sabdariffa TaxID=183260 RepID=A0ABR2ACY8_9ROSI